MSKSRRPLRAVVPCFNMAARTNRTSDIRERNERGFRNFLRVSRDKVSLASRRYRLAFRIASVVSCSFPGVRKR